MNNKLTSVLMLGCFLLTGCNFSISTLPTPTPVATQPLAFITTETPSPVPQVAVATAVIFTPTSTPVPPVAVNICADPQVIALIDSLKKSVLNADGALLSSLVSPNGMEVRWVRYGNPIKYTREQATFLYETTFEADWGTAPGSGQDKTGSFHTVIVPDLAKVFKQSYILQCNEIQHGGASYDISWHYKKDFYSVYFAGTQPNGNLDWDTWAIGIEYVNGKPFIYALMQFFWEP